MKTVIPERGDIILCDLSPTVGHEQFGRRPALVLSGSDINKLSGLVTVCPITSTHRNNFFEVKFATKKTKGVVLTYHLRSIDYVARKVKVVDKVSESIYLSVVKKVEIIIKG